MWTRSDLTATVIYPLTTHLDSMVDLILLVLQRSLLALYIILNRLCRSKRSVVWQDELRKKPTHLLINTTDSLDECLETVKRYGIPFCTIIADNDIAVYSPSDIELYQDHQLVNSNKTGVLKLNILTVDQKHYFVDRINDVLSKDKSFRLNASNLLSTVSPFPHVDLIISNRSRLSFDGCLPCQIGFAEIR